VLLTWYWLADLCEREGIEFVLGHALYMRAIHGAKVKNDKVDSQKIAALLRGGIFPMAYVYPREGAPHVTCSGDGRTWSAGAPISSPTSRTPTPSKTSRSSARRSPARCTARHHGPQSLFLLRTVHGIGATLGLVILYEIQSIDRFARVQEFCSYARLVKCQHEPSGKRSGEVLEQDRQRPPEVGLLGSGGAVPPREPGGMAYKKRLERKHGKAKALSILAHRLGRAASTC
jgi:transposase